ncbi:MAG: hypothetical protein DI598_01510 [Pseudopedobacter saltans]|uniref:Lipoprotein n=1 Tax=Pseudopedobacter saltans TaxID=151895 RepID=A0A2W5HEH0_9SPHI|nr:MAG: hypothetical protein DI598_01510 [Pseudopedobacter saltans]
MKKVVALLAMLFILVSCDSPAPLEYYKRCVLSTVYVQHFGVTEILEILAKPPLEFNSSKKDFDTVNYQQVVKGKIETEQKYLKEVEALKATTDAKEMITASIDVFKTVIKGEQDFYLQLAKMKDDKAPDADIHTKAFSFLEQPEKEVQAKLDLLWGYGKMYADANGIDLTLQQKQENK